MRFSERLGYRLPKIALEEKEISIALRIKLWNFVSIIVVPDGDPNKNSFSKEGIKLYHIFQYLFHHVLNRTVDSMIEWSNAEKNKLRDVFLNADFPEFFDLLEEFCEVEKRFGSEVKKFESVCNQAFSEELCAFRFVDRRLTRIVDQVEIEEIEVATSDTSPEVIKAHISRALALYSERPTSDYRNAVKEAISAVEAAAKIVTGDKGATLGAALKVIEKNHGMHGALKTGFSQIYGYTSGSDGIRHALTDEAREVSEAEARMMIVSCSAFVNYLISLAPNEA